MLRNCTECGKVFSHPSQSLCAQCFKARSEEFTKVKDYLQEHPNAALSAVSEDTEVSIETIYEYIRQGRLTMVPKGAELTCGVCGKPVNRGRVCAVCSGGLQTNTPAPKAEENKSGARVHTLDSLRKRY